MADKDVRGYWEYRRLSRRGIVRGGALGALTLGLAGCAAQPAPPTAPPAAPTTAAAPTAAPTLAPTAVAPKLGGKLTTIATLNEQNLDPHATNGASGGVGATVCYSQLLTYKWGPDVKAPSFIPTGDLAESWTQPDDLTYTFKIRAGAAFHNLAPVNGREADAEDVRTS